MLGDKKDIEIQKWKDKFNGLASRLQAAEKSTKYCRAASNRDNNLANKYRRKLEASISLDKNIKVIRKVLKILKKRVMLAGLLSDETFIYNDLERINEALKDWKA